MRTLPGQGSIPQNEKTDAVFITDLSFSYNMTKNLSIFASASNITNTQYIIARRPAGLRPNMPRAFMGGVKFNF
jgi:Fe(3+) dicitrate transport protein